MEEGTVLRERYRLERLLGRGGMADVYLAFDLQRQVEIAIKVLREDLAEDPEFVRRFQREAETLARLDHPYIVRFYSFERGGTAGAAATLAFIVMDYIPGTTLRGRLAELGGPLDLTELTRILRQVGTALNYAHNLGYVHRDIKPGNIMLRVESGANSWSTALLSDFGIAHVAEGTTMTMGPLGTPAYMSPEQILGRPVGPQADIYSLGVVLYETVTGRRPFLGESGTGTGTTERVRDEHLHAMPPDPRLFNPSLPPAAANVILRCLAKDPAQRYPDVMSLVHDWEQSLGLQHVSMTAGQPQVSTPRTPTPPRPLTGRQPGRTYGGAATPPTVAAGPGAVLPGATPAVAGATPAAAGARPMVPPAYLGVQAPAAKRKGRGWLIAAVAGIGGLLLIAALICVLVAANKDGGGGTPAATSAATALAAGVTAAPTPELQEPSPTPELAEATATEGAAPAGTLFEINSDRGWATDSGDIAIVGEVTNISGQVIDRMVHVVATLTDKDGNQVPGDFRAFVDRPIIPPGEKSSFYILINKSDLGNVLADDVTEYNLGFELSDSPAPDVEIQVVSSQASQDGDAMTITGRAVNNTDQEFVALSLYGTAYDKDKNVLNVLFDLVKLDQPLAPGESYDFSVTASDHCEGAESYYIFVTGWTQAMWDSSG